MGSTSMRVWTAVAAMVVQTCMAQTITASNWTGGNGAGQNVAVDISVSVGSVMAPLASIMALTARAGSGIPVCKLEISTTTARNGTDIVHSHPASRGLPSFSAQATSSASTTTTSLSSPAMHPPTRASSTPTTSSSQPRMSMRLVSCSIPSRRTTATSRTIRARIPGSTA